MNRTYAALTAIAATTLALLVPQHADAAWIHDGKGQTIQPFATWASTSIMPPPNTEIEVHTGPEVLTQDDNGNPVGEAQYLCPTNPSSGMMYPACAQQWGDHWTIRMYDALATWHTRSQRRAVFLHELGHVFDGTTMTDDARARFQRITNNRGPWRDPSNPRSPHERFAEAYKTCAFYGTVLPRHYTAPQEYGYHPAPWQHRATCALVNRIAEGKPA